MQKIPEYHEKDLKLSYQQFQKRGKTLENMIIDKYVVYNLIGEGSNGQVYKGMDDQSKKQVAIKVMNLKAIRNEQNTLIKEIKERLCESQPRLMYQCSSLNLIKCYDVYRNEDLKVMAIEFCNGKTLQAEIDEKRRIPQKQAISIVKHVINGLMELHRHKIIHRDLKAENIMSHNGIYKIIDFGFSKKLEIQQQNAEIKGTSLGTITTMAPQVMSRKAYGLKADIWSLGIIFFQMIYGIYPYDSLTARALYQEIRTRKLFENPNPPQINGTTPTKEAYDFIKFLIVFDTDQRPNWKQVLDYHLIKNESDEVNQRFIQRVEVKADQQLAEMSKKNLEYDIRGQLKEEKKNGNKEDKKSPENGNSPIANSVQKKQKEKQISEQPKIKLNFSIDENIRLQQQKKKRLEELKKQQAPRGLTPAVRELKKEQVLLKRKEQNKEQRQEYEFVQRAHLECLKTQFIFREIFTPLITTFQNSLNDRTFVEFLYLLLARCFNNMSPIQFELKNRKKNKDMIKNLSDQVTPLYNQVRGKFEEYSQKLTKSQNKWTAIVGDFFQKKLSKASFSQKDNYLTGIEFINYTKEEQIKYTFSYYISNFQKKIMQAKDLANTYRRLNKYIEVNRLTQQLLADLDKNFALAVRDIVE